MYVGGARVALLPALSLLGSQHQDLAALSQHSQLRHWLRKPVAIPVAARKPHKQLMHHEKQSALALHRDYEGQLSHSEFQVPR